MTLALSRSLLTLVDRMYPGVFGFSLVSGRFRVAVKGYDLQPLWRLASDLKRDGWTIQQSSDHLYVL